MRPARVWIILLACLAVLEGCNALVGIEDTNEYTGD